MELIRIAGPQRGQTMELSLDTYEFMKEHFLKFEWDSTGDFTGAYWFYEGRAEFQSWLYEELNGICH